MAQITIAQLQAICQQQIPLLSVVFGGEPYQTRQAVDIIRAAVKKDSYTEVKSYEIAKQFDWQTARSEEKNQGLFAQHRLIELYLQDAKLSSKAQKELCAWLSEAHISVKFLLVVGQEPKLDKAAWFRDLFQKAYTIQAKPIPPQHYPRWIAEQFQTYHFSSTPTVYQTIAHVTQGNLLAVEQLLLKLRLLYPDVVEISWSEIKLCLQQDANHTVFEWIDALLSGDKKRTFRILQSLNYKGIEPILILWAITRELRLLYNIVQDRHHSLDWQAITTKYQLWPSRIRTLKSYLLKTKTVKFDKLFRLSFLVEQIIKGERVGDPWQIFAEIATLMLGFSLNLQEEASLCQI